MRAPSTITNSNISGNLRRRHSRLALPAIAAKIAAKDATVRNAPARTGRHLPKPLRQAWIRNVTNSKPTLGYNMPFYCNVLPFMKRFIPIPVLAAVLAAFGCAQLSAPAPYGACAPSRATEGLKLDACTVAVPLFRPDFRANVRFDEPQHVTFTFSDVAVQKGATEQIPEFAVSIRVKGDSISAAFAALNVPFWRISATPSTTAESRHPLLSSRFHAKGFIRDLTFMFWPVKSIEDSLSQTCPGCKVHVSMSGATRTLVRDGMRVLESRTEGGKTVLRNYPEGYELAIEPGKSE